jgi:hypothetical protein
VWNLSATESGFPLWSSIAGEALNQLDVFLPAFVDVRV